MTRPTIQRLLKLAKGARGQDEKLVRFIGEVVQPLLSRGHNLIVFTEYRATQRYLAERLTVVLARSQDIALIHGSMSLDEKLQNVRRFNNADVQILISTEAGGEGLNLHRACHVMVNYDLPWNPARLVQRIGRLYRYGQTKRVVVFNLVNCDSFDNSAIALMLERVETIARDLSAVAGDQRSTMEAEILGSLLEHIDLATILERATDLRIERTQADIDAAIESARQAQALQDENSCTCSRLLGHRHSCRGRSAAPALVLPRDRTYRWHQDRCRQARRARCGNRAAGRPDRSVSRIR